MEPTALRVKEYAAKQHTVHVNLLFIKVNDYILIIRIMLDQLFLGSVGWVGLLIKMKVNYSNQLQHYILSTLRE